MNIYKKYAIKRIEDMNDEQLLARAYSLIQYLWLKDKTVTFPQREEQNNEKIETQQSDENCK